MFGQGQLYFILLIIMRYFPSLKQNTITQILIVGSVAQAVDIKKNPYHKVGQATNFWPQTSILLMYNDYTRKKKTIHLYSGLHF
jgi:hypothetical protein